MFMSWKDALSKDLGGQRLLFDEFQNIAVKLQIQKELEPKVMPESAATRKNSVSSLKVGYKSLKKTKMNFNKIPSFSKVQVSDNSNFSQMDFKNFEDIQNLYERFPCNEYSSIEKARVEAKGNKKITLTKESICKIGEIINKKPIVNKRSLIIKSTAKPVILVQKIINKDEKKFETDRLESVLIKKSFGSENGVKQESYASCEETSDNSEVNSVLISRAENKVVKKRGGWPKGRKRKPELKFEIRPPKAPATGYVIFLNEKRKHYRDMPFKEVTKLLGNEWSKLSLQDKKVYLDQAEIEKKRYREELKAYRQSDAYQNYLQKKRLKRLQGHGTEESDMDATDEIDEEDNEELYCRSCDQWFHSLHNKKEHLYGRQHLQSIAGRCSKLSDLDWYNANMSSTSLDESSLDGSSYLKGHKEHNCNCSNQDSLNMDDFIVKFMVANKEREDERIVLQRKLEESKVKNQCLSQKLQNLNDTVDSLTCMMESEKTTQILLEQHLFNLLNVPSLFYLSEPVSEDN